MTARTHFHCRICLRPLTYRRQRYCGPECAQVGYRARWRAYKASAKGQATRHAYLARPEVRVAKQTNDRRSDGKRRLRKKLLVHAREEAAQLVGRSTWEVLREWGIPTGRVPRPAGLIKHPLPVGWRD